MWKPTADPCEPIVQRPAPTPFLAPALALSLLLGAAATTAALRAQPAGTFRDDISVLEVEVPVQVLVDGRSVGGLSRESFEIRVDGEPREITWFEQIEVGGGAVPASGPPPDSPGAGSTPASGTGTGPAFHRHRHYVLLFDLAFSGRFHLHRALGGAREMVASQLHDSDRVALGYFGGDGVRILVGFTTRREQLEVGLDFIEALLGGKQRKMAAALEALRQSWAEDGAVGAERRLLEELGTSGALVLAGGPAFESLTRRAGFGLAAPWNGASGGALQPREATGGPYTPASLTTLDQLTRQSTLSMIRRWGLAMADLATLLRDVPEPKQLLYFGSGLGGGIGGRETTPVLARLAPMVRAFRTTGWRLQAFDLRGIPAPPVSVETAPEDAGARFAAVDRGALADGFDAHDLHYVADQTGGQLFENYNRPAQATDKLLERTRITYLLAFRTDELPSDGRLHRIDVRLTPAIPGARLFHRTGFHAPRRPAGRSELEQRLDATEMLLGGVTYEELPARVLPAPLGDGGGRVPIFVELPAAALVTPGGGRARLLIHGAALDLDGRVQDVFAESVRFQPGPDEVLRFATAVDLAPGRYDLRILVWNLRTSDRHLTHRWLRVPHHDPPPASVAAWILAGAGPQRVVQGGRAPRDLFAIDGSASFPDLDPVLAGGSSRRILLLARLPRGAPAAMPTARVLDASGAEITGAAPTGWRRLADTEDGIARFVGVLGSGALRPGAHAVEVRLPGATAEPFVVGFEVVAAPAA